MHVHCAIIIDRFSPKYLGRPGNACCFDVYPHWDVRWMDRTILWCCSWSNVAWVSLVCTKLFRSTCCFDTAKILFAAQSIFNHMQQRICKFKYSKHNVTLPPKVKIYTCVPIGRVVKWEIPCKIQSQLLKL